MISVVIPARPGESPALAYESLRKQTYQNLEIILVVDHENRGAPWARNRGLDLARGEYVLFSDADVSWEPTALAHLLHTLEEGRAKGPDADGLRIGYAYGSYYETRHPGWWYSWRRRSVGPIGHRPWSLRALYEHNFISTMSLVCREHCARFDESIERLQDWDLWLHLAIQRKIRGTWAGRPLFSTPYRRGLTYGSRLSYEEARAIVRRKHGLEPRRASAPQPPSRGGLPLDSSCGAPPG